MRTRPRHKQPKGQGDPHAVALGRKGGQKGGPAAAAKLTQTERHELGKRLAAARWGHAHHPPKDANGTG